HAVAHLPRRVGKAPATVRVELDEALHPARPVEIDPPIREPEVGLDDRPADRLEVHEPRVSGEVAAEPLATVRLERRQRLGLHGPVVEGPVAERQTGRVPPPDGLAVQDRHVTAHVRAAENGHPAASGLLLPIVLRSRLDDLPADPHAPAIVDGLAEHPEASRGDPVRAVLDSLRLPAPRLAASPTLR